MAYLCRATAPLQLEMGTSERAGKTAILELASQPLRRGAADQYSIECSRAPRRRFSQGGNPKSRGRSLVAISARLLAPDNAKRSDEVYVDLVSTIPHAYVRITPGGQGYCPFLTPHGYSIHPVKP